MTGQGLDRFARAHLDEFVRGETLKVSLSLPGGRVRIHLEPSSVILRVLAPSLGGEDDLATRLLVRYVGVSNVAAEDGSPQQVEIAHPCAEPAAG